MSGATPRVRVAVVGAGRLGTACAQALLDDGELVLSGVVCRPGSKPAWSTRLRQAPVAAHVRDLPAFDVALVCVPVDDVVGVAHDLLQSRVPFVECAAFEGADLERHHTSLDEAARRHRTTAVVGAGWKPGVMPWLEAAFDLLIPRGQTTRHPHAGVELHHSAAAREWPGVRRALEGTIGGTRYVYVELARGADLAAARAHIEADPVMAGEPVQVFEVDDVAAMEDQVHEGLVLERLATAAAGRHASLLLEARYDLHDFAARAMLDAARRIRRLAHGAHRYVPGL